VRLRAQADVRNRFAVFQSVELRIPRFRQPAWLVAQLKNADFATTTHHSEGRSKRLAIFPLPVRGSAARNSTTFGAL